MCKSKKQVTLNILNIIISVAMWLRHLRQTSCKEFLSSISPLILGCQTRNYEAYQKFKIKDEAHVVNVELLRYTTSVQFFLLHLLFLFNRGNKNYVPLKSRESIPPAKGSMGECQTCSPKHANQIWFPSQLGVECIRSLKQRGCMRDWFIIKFSNPLYMT